MFRDHACVPTFVASLSIAVIWLIAGVAGATEPAVSVANVRMVFDNGQHNAFTDLVQWQDRYWLTFRSCPDGHMIHPTSSILVLSSHDGVDWRMEYQFSVAKRDVRDPHFLVFQNKLFVYTGTWYCGDGSPDSSRSTLNQHLGFGVWTLDGEQWHGPMMLEGTYGHYIWRAATHQGKAYLCGRRNYQFDEVPRGQRKQVESAMLESDDGLVWKTRALFQPSYGNETAFLFEPNGKLLAIGRGSNGPAELIQSQPPYATWKRRKLDRNVGGPLLVRWGDRWVVAGRKSLSGQPPKTAIYFLDPNAAEPEALLSEFAELPSGGDNSYPGMVVQGPEKALISWYSSHETDESGDPKTAIYLAELKIDNPSNGRD